MGISGLLWTKELTDNLFFFFMEKIEFEPEIFHKLTSRAHELFFFSLRAIPSKASRFFFFFSSQRPWKMENYV